MSIGTSILTPKSEDDDDIVGRNALFVPKSAVGGRPEFKTISGAERVYDLSLNEGKATIQDPN